MKSYSALDELTKDIDNLEWLLRYDEISCDDETNPHWRLLYLKSKRRRAKMWLRAGGVYGDICYARWANHYRRRKVMKRRKTPLHIRKLENAIKTTVVGMKSRVEKELLCAMIGPYGAYAGDVYVEGGE